MNDEALEELVRARLRLRAPQDVPAILVLRAAAIPAGGRGSGTAKGRDRAKVPVRWFAFLAPALVAVIVLVGLAVTTRPAPSNSVASQVIPTMPPVTQPSLPPAAAHPSAILAGAWLTPDAAWLVDAQNRLRVTTDGGQTWSEPRPLPRPVDELRGGPTFIDASIGYAVWTPQDVDPVPVWVYRTDDGGRRWSSSQVGTLPSPAGDSVSATVHFTDGAHGLALAGSYHAGPVPSGHAGSGLLAQACGAWMTADAGVTWAVLPGAPCSDHDEWAATSAGIVMPAADGGPDVSLTLDGGATWRTGALPGVGADDAPFETVFTLTPDGSARLAYRVLRGAAGSAIAAQVISAESRDAGATWQQAYELEPPAGLSPDTVRALGADHWIATGFATSGSPAQAVPIFETGDGGRTWSIVGSLGTVSGQSLGWLDRLHGMASGQDNSGCALPSGTPCHADGFFLTNDGGRTWHGVPF
jgi:hypothetical protein